VTTDHRFIALLGRHYFGQNSRGTQTLSALALTGPGADMAGFQRAEIKKLSLLPPELSQNSRSVVSPVGGYARALRLREMAIAADLDVPRYLLAPEIAVLLRYLPDLRQRMLIETLWNTGARINEALALTPSDYFFNADMPFVRLRTLKQRAPRSRGRPTREERQEVPFRALPLPDVEYVRRMQEFFATFRLMTRRATPMWDVASQETPRNWLRAAVSRAAQDGIVFSVRPVTPHTFRHSYAVHLLMNGVHIKQVQALMGHKRLENTEVYTRIFALDVTPDLAFSMSPDSALQLLGLPFNRDV